MLNESSEIIRIFDREFDSLLPANLREISKVNGGPLPPHLEQETNDMNEWIYNLINNGVYKAGFPDTQDGYESNVIALFESLDRVEDILAKGKEKHLLGYHITDADIRLYPTIVRFDVAYHTLFMCNLKMIRHDYPRIQKWLMRLYWDESEETRGAFKKSKNFDAVSDLNFLLSSHGTYADECLTDQEGICSYIEKATHSNRASRGHAVAVRAS